MPLTELQAAVLQVLASRRDAGSYVAGAAPLNRDAARYSQDIDFFHDRAERVAAAALQDTKALAAAGYGIEWIRREPGVHAAQVSRDAARTRLEWVADSDFRFFPTVRDPLFGFVLHPVDLALNKAMAAAGRREVRDLVDLVTIHDQILPLGAVCWAAVEKSPGYTPEGLVAEIRRNAHHPRAAWQALSTNVPIDPGAIWAALSAALNAAEAFFARMPTAACGQLFLQDARVVQPDPGRLGTYRAHTGATGGHWPSSPSIEAAMLQRLSRR